MFYARLAPALIAFSLPVALLSYVLGSEPVTYLAGITGLFLAIMGALMEYTLLLAFQAVRDLAERRRVGLRTLLLPALAIGTYIIGVGIFLARNIITRSLEYTWEKSSGDTGCLPPSGVAAALGLGLPLAAFQDCAVSSIREGITYRCSARSGYETPIDLSSMGNDGQQESWDTY